MPQKKVLRQVSRPHPNQCRRNAVQQEGTNRLGVGHREGGSILPGHNQVKQVLFTLELVAVGPNGAAKRIRFDAYRGNRNFGGGLTLCRVKRRELDRYSRVRCFDDGAEDRTTIFDFALRGLPSLHV